MVYYSNKGQFSTFLKPIIVFIFGFLLISLLTTSLNFNVGLQEEEAETTFQASPGKIATDVSSCLSVNSQATGASTVLNQSKLEKMSMKFRNREPHCAESFRYGYEVEVNQTYLKGVKAGKAARPTDVVFALDDSGSMGGALDQVKDNTKEFIDSLPEGSRVGMFTYATPPSDYINNTIDLTEDVSKVTNELESISTDGGQEPEDKAMNYTLNNFDFKPGKRKILIILATEAATKDTPTSKSPTEWAQEAANEDLTIYTVSGMEGKYDDIADITGGKRYSVTADYSSIFEEISGEERFIGGKSTCTVPPVTKYNGSAQIVVAADASEGFSEDWESICQGIDNKVKTLEAKGLKTEVSYYAPGQPGGPENGEGNPMDWNSDNYNFSSGNIPSCVASNDNAASSKWGQGITAWNGTGLDSYNSSKDSGIEAWGVMSKWILENHDWNSSKDQRMLFIVGDQDPTGGNSSFPTFRTKTGTSILDNETEIVRNVTNLTNNESVGLHFLSPDDLEYEEKDNYDDPSRNDALELMEKATQTSGSSQTSYSDPENLPEIFVEKFSGMRETASGSGGVCTNITYNFGELSGSENENLQDSLQVSLPTSVRQSENLTTPATMTIRIKKGSLEKLAGAINKAVATGKRLNQNTTVYANVQNEETITSRDVQIERKNKTLYQLQKPSGDTTIQVKDDLLVGVNGRKVLGYRDGEPTTIDFSEPENRFNAYKGAGLQIIAVNSIAPDLKLEKLELSCVNGCPNNGQTVNPDLIKASEGSDRYRELGGIGPFYHNFTQIRIGKTDEITEKAVCYSGTDQCVVLRSDNVENLRLRPGSHEVTVRYSPSTGVEFPG